MLPPHYPESGCPEIRITVSQPLHKVAFLTPRTDDARTHVKPEEIPLEASWLVGGAPGKTEKVLECRSSFPLPGKSESGGPWGSSVPGGHQVS